MASGLSVTKPFSGSLADLRHEFERCWPWLEASLAEGAFIHEGKVYPSHNKIHIWDRITNRKCFFWIGEECAFITEFHTSPTGVKSHHIWLAGGTLKDILSMMPSIEAWGKQHGCHRQTGSGRRGWIRAFGDGYREIGVRKEKSLL